MNDRTNSLLDIVVFGRAAAQRALKTVEKGSAHAPLPKRVTDKILARLDKVRFSNGDVSVGEVRNSMQNAMQKGIAHNHGPRRSPCLRQFA